MLVLGGVGNVRYVSGARELGRAGVFPFARFAVVVAGHRSRASAFDVGGVWPEIGRDDLYRMNWNPANLAADLAKIPGLRDARRVGPDGLTPLFAALIPELVTTADLVDAGLVMTSSAADQDAREMTCLDVASGIAEAALSAMDDALAPGITERELLGVYDEQVARPGRAESAVGKRLLRHAVERRGNVSPPGLRTAYRRRRTRRARARLAVRRIRGRPGPHAGGRVGSAPRACIEVCARGGRLVAACWPGNSGADLYRAWERAGSPDPGVRWRTGWGWAPSRR